MSHQAPGLPEVLGYALEGALHFAERVGYAFREAADERRRQRLRIHREPEQLQLDFTHAEANLAATTIEDWDLSRHEWGPEPEQGPPPERPQLRWD